MRFLSACAGSACALVFLFCAYGLTRAVAPGINPAPVILAALLAMVLSGAGAALLLRRALR
jgi:hypothetical protein